MNRSRRGEGDEREGGEAISIAIFKRLAAPVNSEHGKAIATSLNHRQCVSCREPSVTTTLLSFYITLLDLQDFVGSVNRAFGLILLTKGGGGGDTEPEDEN